MKGSGFRVYPEYRDSGIEWLGLIPAHWQVKKLKLTARVVNGSTPKSDVSKYWNGDIVWITPDDLGRLKDKWIKDSSRKITKKGMDSCGTTIIPNNSIVLSTRAPIGHLGITYTQSCTNQGCKSIIINYDYFCFIYVYYFLFCMKEILQSLGQGTTFIELSSQKLKDFSLVLPGRNEQEKIAAFLDKKTGLIDRLIEKKEKLIELLKEQRTAVIHRAVTGGLDPHAPLKDSGIGWLGKIPRHWETIRTKYLFRLVTEQAPIGNNEELLSVYTEIGVKPRKELEERGNKASTTDNYWVVKKGDIIVNKLLAWMGAIGISEYDGVTSPAYDVLRKIADINPYYYNYLLRNSSTHQELKRYSRGIMEMRLRLYFDQFGRIYLPFPPIKEQNDIVRYIENKINKFDDLINKQTKQIELLKEYRQKLISDAVTGKIDVREE